MTAGLNWGGPVSEIHSLPLSNFRDSKNVWVVLETEDIGGGIEIMSEEQKEKKLSKEDLLEVIGHVVDPELQIGLVALGLIYDARHLDDGRVHVTMTLTTPHCPYGPALVSEVKASLMMLPGVEGVHVSLVWDPPWRAEMISEEARLELGFDI